MLQISDKINSELQAIGNPSVHPDLSEHFLFQVSPCTAVLRRLDALQGANRDLFFSRFSRQKRPWWFFGNILLRQFPTYLFMGPTKNSQNCCTNQKLLRNQPILQLYQCHIRGFRMTFGPRLIWKIWKIWTKMRPNIKGHQKNGSVPKWIQFDTNRSNTMNILKLELKPLHSRFQNPGGRRSCQQTGIGAPQVENCQTQIEATLTRNHSKKVTWKKHVSSSQWHRAVSFKDLIGLRWSYQVHSDSGSHSSLKRELSHL